MRNPRLTGLSCFACGRAHDPTVLQTVCDACGMPLRVDYDLAPGVLDRLEGASLWRYRAVLPVTLGEVSLVEGWTPLLRVDEDTWVKDESRNPTGSFKARGMCLAVTMAKHLGVRALAAPSAGNA